MCLSYPGLWFLKQLLDTSKYTDNSTVSMKRAVFWLDAFYFILIFCCILCVSRLIFVSANYRRPPSHKSIGLWWNCYNDTGMVHTQWGVFIYHAIPFWVRKYVICFSSEIYLPYWKRIYISIKHLFLFENGKYVAASLEWETSFSKMNIHFESVSLKSAGGGL